MKKSLVYGVFLLIAFALMSLSPKEDNTQENNMLLCPGPWSNWVQIENCRQGTFNEMRFQRSRPVYVCKTGDLFNTEYEYRSETCFDFNPFNW